MVELVAFLTKVRYFWYQEPSWFQQLYTLILVGWGGEGLRLEGELFLMEVLLLLFSNYHSLVKRLCLPCKWRCGRLGRGSNS
jgi:hypothetical protein